jgi:lipopolysaccharide transport system ATP-binding protein
MIEAENFSLEYSSHAFSDRSFKTAFIGRLRGKKSLDNIRALNNLYFKISGGERVALIGHNGAGKSSLLKSIAGIYPASNGAIVTDGRIRSLFELHLGFEIDATGRENIRYRGLLLGAHPKDIPSLEKSVETFCELGSKLDLPIRTYSSGMLVRLAFGIASYFPGEILLLDEVIAAGDIAFYEKFQVRLNELLEKANILVIATHDLDAAIKFCERGIVLNQGEIIFDGPIEGAIRFYRGLQANAKNL